MLTATGTIEVAEVVHGTDDPRFAARFFRNKYDRWPHTVEPDDGTECLAVVGGCEGCGTAILEGDDYVSDSEDGIILCRTCHPAKTEG